MADPITLALGGVSLVSGLMNAHSNIEASQQQANQLKAQQQTAEYNAQIFELQSQQVAKESTAASNLMNRQTSRLIANQKAQQAQNNYFGQSADMLINQSEANAELDRLNIAYQGEAQSKGLKQQAAFSRYQGSIAGQQIQPTLNAGYMNAGASLIGTAGQTALLLGKQPVTPYLSYGKF